VQSIWSEIRTAPQILISVFLEMHRDCLLERVRLNPESGGLQESVLAKLSRVRFQFAAVALRSIQEVLHSFSGFQQEL